MEVNSVLGGLVNVQLTDRFGNVLPLYLHNGRYFVQANDLQEYRIAIRSLTRDRLEVLTAIDGRNTLRDEVADLHINTGMVISGSSLYEVKGWRMNDEATRPFVFTVLDEETVAKQATGSSRNLGVIAIAVYREYKAPPPAFMPTLGMQPKGLESSPMRGGAGMGTGMGSRLDGDRVGHTTFERATFAPDQVVEIYAMPKWWLVKESILTLFGKNEQGLPSGFPGSSETGYRRFKKIG